MPALAAIGLNIGKEVFHLIGLSRDGKVVLRRTIRRLALTDIFKKLPPCLVGMEVCLSAHFVSRILRALGHEPRIIPAIYVKPFVKGQKNAIRISIPSLALVVLRHVKPVCFAPSIQKSVMRDGHHVKRCQI